MQHQKPQEFIYTGSFAEGFRPILFIMQILGVFPLKLLCLRPPRKAYFSWFSVGPVICLTLIIWNAVLLVTYFHFHRKSAMTAEIMSTYVFHFMALLINGGFLQLATRWVGIIDWWTKKEQRFLQAPYVTKSSKKLKSKLVTIGIAIAVLAVVEHGLYQSSIINLYIKKSKECNVSNPSANDFFSKRFDAVLVYIPSTVAIVLSQTVSLFATVAWNFLDLFIIVISIGITTRFKQHTSALENHLKNEIPTTKSMLRFRLDFIEICELLEYVDKQMGVFMFLSAVNNIFFICSQLLHAFNVLRYFIDYMYYWISLLYLILRTFFLFLTAASVNESAQGPVRLLQNIPKHHWNDESYRLLYQINSSTIALSAMGFFNFTRGLILTMTGTIVTFELVVLQFRNTVGVLQPLCDS